MPEYPHAALIPVRTILARLYPREPDARIIAEDSGLDLSRIGFTDQAIVTWSNILRYANQQHEVDAVIDRTLKDNPRNETLLRARDGIPPPVLEGPEARQWNGPTGPAALEKIMGARSTLVPITYLQIGVERSKAVVRVKRADGSSATGLLVDGNMIITNNHVLPNAEAAKSSVIQFNYQQMPDGTDAPVDELQLLPDAFFKTSVADDWTAVRIDGDPAQKWGTLALQDVRVEKGDPVNIIQHAGGLAKQISLYANLVVFSGGGRVQYLTDTLPGSSGSPVFNARWNIVALHHSGGWLPEHNAATKGSFYRNEGISVDRIISGLKA